MQATPFQLIQANLYYGQKRAKLSCVSTDGFQSARQAPGSKPLIMKYAYLPGVETLFPRVRQAFHDLLDLISDYFEVGLCILLVQHQLLFLRGLALALGSPFFIFKMGNFSKRF